jgi:PAS domain S-box-containing protein
MSEEELVVLLDKNADIVEFQDPSGITGYSIEEVVNSNWFEIFIHYVDQKEVMLVFNSLFANEAPHWTYDNRIICKNGLEKLLRFNNRKVKSASGKTTYIASSAFEVSYQFLGIDDL